MKMSQFHTYTFTNVIIDARQVAYSNNLSVHNSYQGTISLFHFSATQLLLEAIITCAKFLHVQF